MPMPSDHNGSTLLSRPDAITDFIAPYNAGADGLVIWGDAGGNPKALSCMCDPQHNGPTNPSYFENIKQQTGAPARHALLLGGASDSTSRRSAYSVTRLGS
jgi:hypothetical protein